MKMSDIKRFLGCGVAAFAALATACVAEETTPFTGSELGALQKVYEVESVADALHVDVYSNNTYTISLLNNADWVTFPSTSSGDKGFDVSYNENTETHRQAILRLAIDKYNHADTVYIRQRGLAAQYLKMANSGIVVSGNEAGESTTEIDTNVDFDQIEVAAVNLSEGDEWISDLRVEEQAGKVQLVFGYAANGSATDLRKARITMSYINGWNVRESYEVIVTQRTSANTLGQVKSFADVRAMAEASGVEIDEDIIIEGIVVSNPESGNAGDNTQNSPATIDYSVCERTVYLESVDGEYGFMLKTVTKDDNIFSFGDKVSLSLRGVKLFRSTPILSKMLGETTPDYYWMENIEASMIVSHVAGAAVPVKAMSISELTDEDIFTYVQLQECEITMRKGPMTPINEGYANATGANRTAKFPILVHDKNGDALYVYTNTTCPYRRDGKRLPYGAGTMSGVIVHELYTRFEYADNDTGDEDTYGNIGRYQIRHQSYADFGMKQDVDEAFSTTLAEWAYVTDEYLRPCTATHGIDKSARMEHTYRYASGDTNRTCITMRYPDYSYLGPVGNSTEYIFGNNRGNENGLGVILEDGTNWMAPGYTGYRSDYLATINNNSTHAGKGQVPKEVGSAWSIWYNFDSNGHECSFLFTVSTKNVTATDKLYAVASMQNAMSSNQFGPRYWFAEYSTTDNTGRGDDVEWTTIKRFSVPDCIQWTPTSQLYQCAGFKSVFIELPAEKLAGKDEIYIRLRPDSKGGFGSTLEYITSQKAASPYLPWTLMNYFAVRYNN
ncbi:MAG: hypothetical protein IJF63_07160 [Alistipes sp.]|nr:hypothetical protein [Alistipes sp.]